MSQFVNRSTPGFTLPKLSRAQSNITTDQGEEATCYAHAVSHILSRYIKVSYDKYFKDESGETIETCSDYYRTTSCDDIINCIMDFVLYEKEQYGHSSRNGETSNSCLLQQEIFSALLFSYIYHIITKKYGCNGGNILESIQYFLEQINTNYEVSKIKDILNYNKEFDLYLEYYKDVVDFADIFERFSEIITVISNEFSKKKFMPGIYFSRDDPGSDPMDQWRNLINDTKLYKLLHILDKKIETWTDYELFVHMLEFVLQQKLYAILTMKISDIWGHAVTIVEYSNNKFYIKNSRGGTNEPIGDKYTDYDPSKNMYMITKHNLLKLLSEDDNAQLVFVFPDHLIRDHLIPDHLIPDTLIGGGKKIKKSNRKKKIRHLKSKTKRKYKNFK